MKSQVIFQAENQAKIFPTDTQHAAGLAETTRSAVAAGQGPSFPAARDGRDGAILAVVHNFREAIQ